MEPIGPEVARELRRFAPEAGVEELAAAWPHVAGDGIARHAWPARLGRDATLHVATESSTWAFELAQLAPRLLERFREVAPALAPRQLRFAVGPLPARGVEEPAAEARARAEPSPAQRLEAAALVAPIADAELRALVAETAATSLARASLESPSDR